LKRLLDTWDRNESTIDPTPWQIYDDDDDDDKVTVDKPDTLILNLKFIENQNKLNGPNFDIMFFLINSMV
jgi:hypothetical protein